MTASNKDKEFNQRQREKRQSRLKLTKQYISANSTIGLLNNSKWLNLFEYLDRTRNEFQIKTLMANDLRSCSYIRELESMSVLIDDSGDFIEFLEIDTLRTKSTDDIIKLLDNLNIEYSNYNGFIEVCGYRNK